MIIRVMSGAGSERRIKKLISLPRLPNGDNRSEHYPLFPDQHVNLGLDVRKLTPSEERALCGKVNRMLGALGYKPGPWVQPCPMPPGHVFSYQHLSPHDWLLLQARTATPRVSETLESDVRPWPECVEERKQFSIRLRTTCPHRTQDEVHLPSLGWLMFISSALGYRHITILAQPVEWSSRYFPRYNYKPHRCYAPTARAL